MHAMYDTMRLGSNGFTFAARDLDVDRELTDVWERMAAPTSGKRPWPPTTDDMRAYDFDFNFGFQRFMTFSWLEYPGAVIYSTDKDEMRPALQESLNQADGILVCLPSDKLLESEKTQKFQKAINVGEINRMFAELRNLKGSSEELPAVILVFTKFDLFAKHVLEGQGPMGDDQRTAFLNNKIERIARETFSGLFNQGVGWSVLVCPVSLGLDLPEKRDLAALDPINMDLPVLFTFLEFARQVGRLRQADIQALRSQINAPRGGFFSRFSENKVDRERQVARLDELLKMATKLREQADIVERNIPKEAIIYRNGVRQMMGTMV